MEDKVLTCLICGGEISSTGRGRKRKICSDCRRRGARSTTPGEKISSSINAVNRSRTLRENTTFVGDIAHCKIYGNKGRCFNFILDRSDVERPEIGDVRWRLRRGSLVIARSYPHQRLTQVIMNPPPGRNVMYVGDDRFDLRRSNLRLRPEYPERQPRSISWTHASNGRDVGDGIVSIQCKALGGPKDGEMLKTFVDSDVHESMIEGDMSVNIIWQRMRNSPEEAMRGYYRANVKVPKSVENGKTKYHVLSRWVMDAPNKMVVDHVDGDTLMNTRSNLRICSIRDNVKNRHHLDPRNKTGVHGVGLGYKGRFIAYISIDGRQVRLGEFTDLEEAARVRREAEIKYYGEFAPHKLLKKKTNINTNPPPVNPKRSLAAKKRHARLRALRSKDER